MKKREAQFTILFRHWLKANSEDMKSGAFELKYAHDDYFPFNAVEEHQLQALQASKSNSGMIYKIPDDSRSIKPYDMFFLREAKAYVVVKYSEFFCLIDVDDFIKESKISKRRSLTPDRAMIISKKVIHL